MCRKTNRKTQMLSRLLKMVDRIRGQSVRLGIISNDMTDILHSYYSRTSLGPLEIVLEIGSSRH